MFKKHLSILALVLATYVSTCVILAADSGNDESDKLNQLSYPILSKVDSYPSDECLDETAYLNPQVPSQLSIEPIPVTIDNLYDLACELRDCGNAFLKRILKKIQVNPFSIERLLVLENFTNDFSKFVLIISQAQDQKAKEYEDIQAGRVSVIAVDVLRSSEVQERIKKLESKGKLLIVTKVKNEYLTPAEENLNLLLNVYKRSLEIYEKIFPVCVQWIFKQPIDEANKIFISDFEEILKKLKNKI